MSLPVFVEGADVSTPLELKSTEHLLEVVTPSIGSQEQSVKIGVQRLIQDWFDARAQTINKFQPRINQGTFDFLCHCLQSNTENVAME